MNKTKRSISQSLLLLFFAVQSSTTYCQSQKLSFNNTALHEVIETLEQKSDYVFNYDPELLKGYYFSGSVNLVDVKDVLNRILYESPYTFELEQNTILVYRADQKNYRICGIVRDAKTQEPLIAASIAGTQTTIGSQSNVNGFFDFNITADKNQKIEISYLGYKTKSFMVPISNDGDCPIYSLEIDEILMGEEILVTDYILDGIYEGNEFGGVELNFDRLSKNHSNVEHDILKTAQLLPGINSNDDSATNLQIRSSNPDQNLILWEGAPVYNAGHIFGMISAINPFSTHGVSIYKGAHDPQYDNRVGGIIDISLTDSIDNDFHGSIGSTLTELHTNLDIPIEADRMSLLLSGRQSINGIYDSPTLQSYTDKVFQFSIIDDQSENTRENLLNTEQVLDYSDWNAKLIYQASDQIGVNLGIYSNHQDFKYSFSFEDDPFLSEDKITVDTKIVNAEIDFELSKRWSSLFSFYNSSYDNEYRKEESENGSLLTANNQFNNLKDKSFTFSNIIKATANWNVKAGYEYNTKEVNFDLGENINFDSDFEPKRDEAASFQNLFLSTAYAGRKIKIDAGIRTTYYQERDKWVHSPRVNLQYSINDKLKLKADGGIYHQFISQLTNFGINQIKVDNPLWILNTTDTQLSQKANKVAAGFVFRQNGWLVDVDAYYNQTIGLSTVSPVFRLLSAANGFLKGSSTAKGIDFLLKKRWSGFNTWVNYSLAVAKNDFPDISENPFFAPTDIRHNLSIITSYKIKNIQFSVNANYHSGLPYTRPLVVPNDDPGELDPPFLFFLEYDEFNDNRLEPYMRLDFNVNYRLSFKKLRNVKSEISFTIINLFNSENVLTREYYLEYDELSMRSDLVYVRKVLLDRTPLLLVRFYW